MDRQDRRAATKRGPRVLAIGPDGREVYTKDPDARMGHRSATNSRQAGPYQGYELHTVVQVRDVKSSDGVQRVSFGRDVPPVITDFDLTPAGSRRDDAVVPTLIAAKEAGHDIREVVWDRGYSQPAAEATTHPLRRAGIDTVFPPEGTASAPGDTARRRQRAHRRPAVQRAPT